MDRCGAVSLKRGEAFYRNDKVSFEKYSPDYIEATVSALEDFYVTIEKDPSGSMVRVAVALL